MASIFAELPGVKTSLVLFDTAVVDRSDQVGQPVDVLLSVQLGGGTDINRALTYCESVVRRPSDTVLVLISDLYEGGSRDEMLKRAASLVASGVRVIALLALSDEGAPGFDHANAAAFAALGIPAFACTPDQFPDLMAAGIGRQDIAQWAAARGIATGGGGTAH